MGRVWAVAKNSFVSAMRMKVAVVFILLLSVLLPIMCLTSTGDNTVKGRAQSFISYGLGLTSFLLSILTIIASCYSLSSDIKHKQIYMVITKPIRRFELMLGKVLGVVLLDLMLLFVFSSIIYILTIQIPQFSNVQGQEIDRLNNEFFTARASLEFDLDELVIENRANEAYKELERSGQLSESRNKQAALRELRDSIRFSMYSAEPGGMILWEFRNVKPLDANENIFIRFKANASRIPPDRNIYGVWYVGDYRQVKYGQEKVRTPIYAVPRKDSVQVAHEFEIPADSVAEDGYLAVVFYNEPANNTTVIFSEEDGFSVLYEAGSFGANFIRAILIIFARLVFFAALGVSLSAWLGFPVAILCSLVIFFTGMINSFIVGSFAYLGQNISLFYKLAIEPFIWLLPKFDQSHNIGKYIVDARLINIGFFITSIAALAIKAAVLLLAGFIIFARREIAKVIV
ncbi:MAG: ABC transporter permease [Phycisphaerae bacterium]|nr:ABC transporter permease [Phycisphaerae bacterium]